jgi:outer membrane protein assembly factor BamA
LNWQDLKLIFSHKSASNSSIINYKTNIDISGNILNLFSKYQKRNSQNQYMILDVPYSQFVKLDNEFIQGVPFSKFESINYKLGIGIGVPYGNSRLALPFDYSFFGGGPNDNRGWRAGSLGPGSYNYYLDKNYSTVQLGDIRLALSTEYRFKLTKYLRGALFMDAGNIWTYNLDEKRPGSQFSNNWLDEIAVASGFGVRADFEYFLIRMDFGFKLRNPALASGKRWFFEPNDEEVQNIINDNPTKFSSPFFPKNWNDLINSVRVGIGYPF